VAYENLIHLTNTAKSKNLHTSFILKVARNLKKMAKTILIVILTFLIFSCTEINQNENNMEMMENLRAENDRLKKS